MEKEILKSALFGYSKISVCQYIAEMSEEFNEKLMAEAESFREERAIMQKKIDNLEAELAVYKQNASDANAILQEAEQQAEHLRKQAQEEAAQLRLQAEEESAQRLLEIDKIIHSQTRRIEVCSGAIAKFQEDMAMLSNHAEEALNALMKEFVNLQQDIEDHA